MTHRHSYNKSFLGAFCFLSAWLIFHLLMNKLTYLISSFAEILLHTSLKDLVVVLCDHEW